MQREPDAHVQDNNNNNNTQGHPDVHPNKVSTNPSGRG